MKIAFSTNIDAYKTNCFPNNLKFVPRVGEKVSVVKTFRDYYLEKGLFTYLEVVDVKYMEEGVLIKLHYTETQSKMLKIKNNNI